MIISLQKFSERNYEKQLIGPKLPQALVKDSFRKILSVKDSDFAKLARVQGIAEGASTPPFLVHTVGLIFAFKRSKLVGS